MKLVICLIFCMIGGLALSRVVKLLHLPNVTGYLIAGLILGKYCLNLVDTEALAGVSTVTSIALGFIAFSIGGEFKLAHIRKLGAQVLVITVVQAVTTVLLVMLCEFILSSVSPDLMSVPASLLLGAIAAATAPAATLMVVRQYAARGPVTDTLLPVVAFDDAIGLMIFSVCVALAKAFSAGEAITVTAVLLEPLKEIGLSLVIGAALGALLALMMRFFKSRANRLTLMLVAVFSGVVLSEMLDLSSLLTCMMIGALFCNIRDDATVILEGIDRWTPPLFMLFFVFSGAELDLKVIPLVGVAGIVYLVSRSIGKYFGAFFGASMVHSDPNVRKYLGITLLPQAGVAIGMASLVASDPALKAVSSQIVTIVLSATLVYELIGPLLTKIALTKAGEIEKPEPKKKAA